MTGNDGNGPNQVTHSTAEELHAVVLASTRSDADWSRLLASQRSHATLTMWADALSASGGLTRTVRLLRGHVALRQWRYDAAVKHFVDALKESALSHADRLALAAAHRAVGRHRAALAALGTPAPDEREETALWRAVSMLMLGDVVAASHQLSQLPRPLHGRQTAWLEGYLESALAVRDIGSRLTGQSIFVERYRHTTRARAASSVFAVLDYKSPDRESASANIGDYIQSVALLRHLARLSSSTWSYSDDTLAQVVSQLSTSWRPESRRPIGRHVHVSVVDRDNTWPMEWIFPQQIVWTVLHGWFHGTAFGCGSPFPCAHNVEPVYLSFHLDAFRSLDDSAISHLRENGPIGCRDWSTVGWLLNVGVDAFFSGCVTLTLPRSNGPRDGGRLFVDAVASDETVEETHIAHETGNTRDAPFGTNLTEASRLLRAYGEAAHVTTSRLHCYLPCLALGTPVVFTPHNPSNRRLDGLLDPGDVQSMSDRVSSLLGEILPLMCEGRSVSSVRSKWRELTLPFVDDSRRYINSAAPLARSSRRHVATSTQRAKAPSGRGRTTVVLAFDNGYLSRVKPLLVSIMGHSSRPVRFVWLVRHLQRNDLEPLLRLAGASTVVIEMSARLRTTEVNLARGTTLSTMDRLFVPGLLPEMDRVVYLDVDTVMLGDVCELIDCDPSRRGVAARVNPAPQLRFQADVIEAAARPLDAARAHSLRRAASCHLDLRARCLNAGVLVLSLQALRAHSFTRSAVQLVRDFGVQDEQALNIYAGGDFAELPPSWNFMPYLDVEADAKLIHWAGSNKPWMPRPILRDVDWLRHGGTKDDHDGDGAASLRPAPKAPYGLLRTVAELVPSGSTILELCRGGGSLGRWLSPECRCVTAGSTQRADVVEFDLNAYDFPGASFEVIVMVDVLEQLDNPQELLSKAGTLGDHLVLSYRHAGPDPRVDTPHAASRRNDLSESQLRALLGAAGWTIRSIRLYADTPRARHVIYLLDRLAI